jgi:hypothetical protein
LFDNIRSFILHQQTINTMSDDHAKYFHGFLIEELNDLKDEERKLTLAEYEVDDRMRRFDFMQRFSFHATVVPRKRYEHGTKEWAVRLLIETEEADRNSDDEEVDDSDDENSLDRIEKVDYVLKVLQHDIQDVRDYFQQDVKEIKFMTRMISELTTMYAEKKEMLDELRREFFRRRDHHTKVVRGNDGKRYHVLVSPSKQLAKNDDDA